MLPNQARKVEVFFNNYRKTGNHPFFNFNLLIDNNERIPNHLKHSNILDGQIIQGSPYSERIDVIGETALKRLYLLSSDIYRGTFIESKYEHPNALPFGVLVNDIPFKLSFIYMLAKEFVGDDDSFKKNDDEGWINYIKEYKNGFFEGFRNFEKKIKDSCSTFFDDTHLIEEAIFTYATSNWLSSYGPVTTYKMRYDDDDNLIGSEGYREVVDAYETGISFGQIYRAWSIVLRSPDRFESKAQAFLDSRPYVSQKVNSDLTEIDNNNKPNYFSKDDTIPYLLFGELRKKFLDDDVTEDLFVRTLTGERNENDSAIKISCNTNVFAILIEQLAESELRQHLKQLKDIVVEGGFFMSKKGTLLKKSNLENSYTKVKPYARSIYEKDNQVVISNLKTSYKNNSKKV